MLAKSNSPTAKYKQRRDLILDVAARLFNEHGLRGTTLSDVAEAIGLVAHSVTYYYARKDDLAAACFLRSIAALDALIAAASAEASAQRRLEVLLQSYFELLASIARGEQPELVMFRDMRALSSSQAPVVFDAYTNLFRHLRDLLFPRPQTARATASNNARTHLVLSAINGAKIWIDEVDIADYRRAAHCLADLLLNGAAASDSAWAPQQLRAPAPPDAADTVTPASFLRAAAVLINDEGYKGASVEKISAYLNVTKGSFYHHNEAKDDLVARCFGHSFDIIQRAQQAALAAPGTGWTRLTAVAADLVSYQLSSAGPLIRNTALSALPAAYRLSIVRQINVLSNRFGNLFVDGIIDGSIRPLDPRIAAHVLNSTINAAAELGRWVSDVTERDAAELFIRPLLVGLFDNR